MLRRSISEPPSDTLFGFVWKWAYAPSTGHDNKRFCGFSSKFSRAKSILNLFGLVPRKFLPRSSFAKSIGDGGLSGVVYPNEVQHPTADTSV